MGVCTKNVLAARKFENPPKIWSPTQLLVLDQFPKISRFKALFFLQFIMAARKHTAHCDKSKFVLFSVFGRFCWKFFFPYGSNYGLSLTTKLHVIELLFVNFLVLLWLFFSFQCWWTLAWASTGDSHVVIFSGCGRRGVKSVALSASWQQTQARHLPHWWVNAHQKTMFIFYLDLSLVGQFMKRLFVIQTFKSIVLPFKWNLFR